MYASILEIDLHGKNIYQSRITIDAALRHARPGLYRIRLIHGGNSGTALRNFIAENYARHPRVLRLCAGANAGITELVLREY